MKTFLFSTGLFLSFLLTTAQPASDKPASDYILEISNQRKQKDIDFVNEKASPLPDEEKEIFKGLHYYDPKPELKVAARLEKFDNPFHFKMKTTTDRLPEYALFGKLSFSIQGQEYSLNVYQNIDLLKKPGYDKYLFIPFNDLTNGQETYGGGRFMDGEIPDSDTMVIDFNNAYNPYCAYNHKYSCPIPPEENSLPIKIEAGEMKYHE